MKRSVPLVLFLALPLLSCVVVKHDAAAAKKKDGSTIEIFFANDAFDAAKFVNELWEPKILPHTEENGTELGALIAGLRVDEAGTSAKYGVRHVGEGAPFNFAVKGSGTVLSVNTVSRNGTFELDLAPCDGKADAIVQIGPVFKGTAIRDALPFVTFDDFTNQLDYANLGNELNARVRDVVVAKLDPATLAGRTVDFLGYLTYEAGKPIVVVPVKLSAK